jgi:hypothetical protein
MKSERAPHFRLKWNEIPGWFQWRSAQEEAVRHFPDGTEGGFMIEKTARSC